jgi:cytoskeletal protein RodZ
MRRQREERGVTLRQIADATKISVVALEALERNDASRLPGGLFSRAFVRAYALEVGLEPEQTVRDFLVQFPEDPVTAGSQHARGEDFDWRTVRPSATLVVRVLVASAVIAVIAYFALSIP